MFGNLKLGLRKASTLLSFSLNYGGHSTRQQAIYQQTTVYGSRFVGCAARDSALGCI